MARQLQSYSRYACSRYTPPFSASASVAKITLHAPTARSTLTSPHGSTRYSIHARLNRVSPAEAPTYPWKRRTVLAVSGITVATTVGIMALAAAAATAAVSGKDPNALVRSGMQKFRKGDVAGSLEDFNAAYIASERLRPYLWQRGLSLYYAEQYSEGAAQFREDVAVNPNDTEEAIWAFLCEAQTLGVDEARKQFLKVGRDPRPVLRAAEESFRTGSPPGTILAVAQGQPPGSNALFYGYLYLGLWHEAHGQADEAREALRQAAATPYGQLSDDYMAALCKVHLQRRGWAL